MTDPEVRDLLRRKVEVAGSQAAFARDYHVDRSTVSLILGAGKSEHRITPEVLRALGLREVTSYEPRD